jgi:hypothetical protein
VDKDAVPLMQVLEDFLAPLGMTPDMVALKFSETVQKLYVPLSSRPSPLPSPAPLLLPLVSPLTLELRELSRCFAREPS